MNPENQTIWRNITITILSSKQLKVLLFRAFFHNINSIPHVPYAKLYFYNNTTKKDGVWTPCERIFGTANIKKLTACGRIRQPLYKDNNNKA